MLDIKIIDETVNLSKYFESRCHACIRDRLNYVDGCESKILCLKVIKRKSTIL